MRPDVLIVGQGIAGTLLAWELEQANVSFVIADAGHDVAASRVAAGMINPITGQRMVKTTRVNELLPLARQTYQAIGSALGVELWRELRVRRIFASDRERQALVRKHATGELAPNVDAHDETGFWIEGAGQVAVGTLLVAARQRWQQQGRLAERPVDVRAELKRHGAVVDCSGLAGARSELFKFLPWEFSKGELLEIAVDGLAPDVVLNSGHWVLPIEAGRALVGATHEPGVLDTQPTAAAEAALAASATALLQRPFCTLARRAGVRVNLPDRLPVIGVHPDDPRLGLLNGLGAKGALWAPALAQSWVRQLVESKAFDPAFTVTRFCT
jgi:glycine/D-amino acid oxidase-like deaminating enzyme